MVGKAVILAFSKYVYVCVRVHVCLRDGEHLFQCVRMSCLTKLLFGNLA